MKKSISFILIIISVIFVFSACQNADTDFDGRIIILSDSSITLDGKEIKDGDDVTVTHDIIYYKSGQDESYGEGSEADAHSAEEADKHTVVTIKSPGKYMINGKLSAGQIAVDLGADAKTNPEAVVTLVLNNADITCTVAPAVIFYNVYECDTEWVAFDNGDIEAYPSKTDIDTSRAGANVIMADGSVNNINGSYVAKIFKENSDKKLHKYDGAFYSKMTINIYGESGDTGVLNINAENEGLDSELHLTINGGNINITSQNDGINTNEDNVSVTTVNGGSLHINAGLGNEGDGIDSNGHIVINGGNIYTTTNEISPDGGLDADGEILINGGNVSAFGTSNGSISSSSKQNYMELFFKSAIEAGSTVELHNANGEAVFAASPEKDSASLIISSNGLEKDVAYTLYVNGEIQEYSEGAHGFGGFGGGRPGGTPPEGFERPEGGFERPEGDFKFEIPEDGFEMPEGGFMRGDRPERDFNTDKMPSGNKRNDMSEQPNGFSPEESASSEFVITDSISKFSGFTRQDPIKAYISNKTFSYEKGGYTGENDRFYITLNSDGTYDCSESGSLSIMLHGFWTLNDNILTLTQGSDTEIKEIYFKVEEDCLIFQNNGSVSFNLISLSDGDKFILDKSDQ